jgi:hypothetical protein
MGGTPKSAILIYFNLFYVIGFSTKKKQSSCRDWVNEVSPLTMITTLAMTIITMMIRTVRMYIHAYIQTHVLLIAPITKRMYRTHITCFR